MFEIDFIKTKKNLLAFSAGVDSSALFFILLNNNIEFDIIIVDYNQREQSKQEIQYAKDLSKKYNKKCFTTLYTNDKFSEKDARDFRYSYFEKIIQKYNYEAIITAHQLNDKFEWFLMQLSKGAGVVELIGLKKITYRTDYILYRPLLDITKDTLIKYLQENNIKYFIDSSNSDPKYKRNYFRKEFSDKFIKEYQDGILKSMNYLQNDIDTLNSLYDIFEYKQLSIAKFKICDDNLIIKFIDRRLKEYGIIISKSTRDEILKQKEIIISNKISVSIIKNLVWISLYEKNSMNKKFKDFCRINKIPKNNRFYLSKLNKNDFKIFYEKYNEFILNS